MTKNRKVKTLSFRIDAETDSALKSLVSLSGKSPSKTLRLLISQAADDTRKKNDQQPAGEAEISD